MKKLVFIGSGSMAEAIIAGILKAKIMKNSDIYVTNKKDADRLNYMKEIYGVKTSYDREELLEQADAVVLAMKPKDVHEALHELRGGLSENQLVISVLAGIMTSTIEQTLDMQIPVIRSMPNTSAMIGYSATAIANGKYVNDNHQQLATELLQTIGTTKIVKEEDMHTVTAVSGSGPAFVYYFVEAMTNAATGAGLDQKTADELIAQTILGAGQMLKSSGSSAETLRENITSKGGTTEAGLTTLADHNFENIMMECIANARKRSMDLGKNFYTTINKS